MRTECAVRDSLCIAGDTFRNPLAALPQPWRYIGAHCFPPNQKQSMCVCTAGYLAPRFCRRMALGVRLHLCAAGGRQTDARGCTGVGRCCRFSPSLCVRMASSSPSDPLGHCYRAGQGPWGLSVAGPPAPAGHYEGPGLVVFDGGVALLCPTTANLPTPGGNSTQIATWKLDAMSRRLRWHCYAIGRNIGPFLCLC